MITQLSRFSALHVFAPMSLGETVSVQDKIRQRNGESGVSPKPDKDRRAVLKFRVELIILSNLTPNIKVRRGAGSAAGGWK